MRLNNHKSATRNPNTDESVGTHFQLADHTLSDLSIQIVQTFPNIPSGPQLKTELNKAESRWMHRLKSNVITGGLNVDEPFFHNLTFSN